MDMVLKIGDADSGVWISNLLDSEEFLSRSPKERNPHREKLAMERLNRQRSKDPRSVLQELVDVAVEYCRADSAGLSLEELNDEGALQFRWIVVAGSFARYLNGTTPRFYSPCGTCIDRGVAQHYKVTHPYYNFLGVTADPICDGLLIPWHSGNLQGTIWLVSHASDNAFDKSDYQFLKKLADQVSAEISAQAQNGGSLV